MNWAIVVAIVAIIAILAAIFFVKRFLIFLFNSLLGLFALMGWNVLFPSLAITINIWSVLLVALFGIVGLIFVLVFHFTGIAF